VRVAFKGGKVNRYTDEDYEVLWGMLCTTESRCIGPMCLSSKEDFYRVVKENMQDSEIVRRLKYEIGCFSENDKSSIVRDLFRHNRIHSVMYTVPLERIPLYINDPDTELIARWRLRVAK